MLYFMDKLKPFTKKFSLNTKQQNELLEDIDNMVDHDSLFKSKDHMETIH